MPVALPVSLGSSPLEFGFSIVGSAWQLGVA
jgi:hypothetical protein